MPWACLSESDGNDEAASLQRNLSHLFRCFEWLVTLPYTCLSVSGYIDLVINTLAMKLLHRDRRAE